MASPSPILLAGGALTAPSTANGTGACTITPYNSSNINQKFVYDGNTGYIATASNPNLVLDITANGGAVNSNQTIGVYFKKPIENAYNQLFILTVDGRFALRTVVIGSNANGTVPITTPPGISPSSPTAPPTTPPGPPTTPPGPPIAPGASVPGRNVVKLINKGNDTVSVVQLYSTLAPYSLPPRSNLFVEVPTGGWLRATDSRGEQILPFPCPISKLTREVAFSRSIGESLLSAEHRQKFENDWLASKTLELVYKTTRDGASNATIGEKVGTRRGVVIFILTRAGYIFGAYTEAVWPTPSGMTDVAGFLFTLVNPSLRPPTKFASKNATVYVGPTEFAYYFGGGDLILRVNTIPEVGTASCFGGIGPLSGYAGGDLGGAVFTGATGDYFADEVEIYAVV